MQAIELETTISPQGSILLPADFKSIYGCHARMILLLEDHPSTVESMPDQVERQAAMRQSLAAVAQAGIFSSIDDATAWQREARADRMQPGREG
ncbi:MAG: hypothetical protein Q8O25_11100 [Sulfurisoma sp.]|nr:hypothetical protein [Sulfurisoma sp.]